MPPPASRRPTLRSRPPCSRVVPPRSRHAAFRRSAALRSAGSHDRGLAAASHDVVYAPSERSGDAADSPEPPDGESAGTAPDDRTDEALLEQAHNAANGETFRRLWRGSTAGYESHLEADMALCCLLAFWTRGDADWMNSLFRDSGLMRPKWDEVHYADGSTYGSKTIQRAIARTSAFYEPEARAGSSVPDEPDGAEASAAPAGEERALQPTQTTAVSLEEQDRILRQRVRDQGETIERQATDIEGLDDELDALRTTLADREGQLEPSADRADSSSAGILTRVRRRFRDDRAE